MSHTQSSPELKSALHYFNIKSPPLVEVTEDPDPEKGLTLMAREDIPQHQPVILYYGKSETPEENVEAYFDDPEDYIKNKAPYIRALTESKSINASHMIPTDIKPQTEPKSSKSSKSPKSPKSNLNLLGVLVNDVNKPKSLRAVDLIAYLDTQEDCNLIPSHQTNDYPLYISKRPIKKGEILTVHYGLGYWLLQLGIPPPGIGHIIQSIMLYLKTSSENKNILN